MLKLDVIANQTDQTNHPYSTRNYDGRDAMKRTCNFYQSTPFATLATLLVVSSLVGCRSGGGMSLAKLNPWSSSPAAATDTSLAARTAPELPSQQIAQAEAGAKQAIDNAANTANNAINSSIAKASSAVAPAFDAASAPAFDAASAATIAAAPTASYPTTPNAAPNGTPNQAAPGGIASSYRSMASAPPVSKPVVSAMATPPAAKAKAASMPYDPNAYASTAPSDSRYGTTAATTPAAPANSNAPTSPYGSTPYGSTDDRYTNTASLPTLNTKPVPPTMPPTQTAAATTAATTPSMSSPATPASTNPPPAGGDRYSRYSDDRYATTPTAESVDSPFAAAAPASTPATSPVQSAYANTDNAASSVSQASASQTVTLPTGAYRPGGTSTYQSPVSVATRPETKPAAPAYPATGYPSTGAPAAGSGSYR